MRRLFFYTCILTLTLPVISCATGIGAGMSLQDAIEQSAQRIAADVPAGSRVAIIAFETEHENLSNHIIEELTGALLEHGIEVVDRRNLNHIIQELHFHVSGDVSDETAQAIGRFVGAELIITGRLTYLGRTYRYQVNTVYVETAKRGSVARLNVQNSAAMRRTVAALTHRQSPNVSFGYGMTERTTPDSAGRFLDRGILFAMRGEYDMAIMDFTDALKLNPNLFGAYMLRGRALYAGVSNVITLGENFGAVANIMTVADLDFNFTLEELSAENRLVLEKALSDFTQAIRLDPNSARAYTERGLVFLSAGNTIRAFSDLNQAIRLDPNLAIAYNNRGFAYLSGLNNINTEEDKARARRDLNAALADLNQAIRLDPNLAIAHLNRGLAYFYSLALEEDLNNILTNLDLAIADFSRAIRLNRNLTTVYFLRGFAYSIRGFAAIFTLSVEGAEADFNSAVADFEQALRIDPDNTAIREFLEILR